MSAMAALNINRFCIAKLAKLFSCQSADKTGPHTPNQDQNQRQEPTHRYRCTHGAAQLRVTGDNKGAGRIGF